MNVKLFRQVFTTTNTKEAAALLTLGVPFVPEKPVTNTYDADKPYRRDDIPGRVAYNFEGKSAFGAGVDDLSAAWSANTADKELDQLLAEIAAALPPELSARLTEILPRALMCYCRGALENRERILDMWKKGLPMFHFKKGENSFVLVSKGLSKEQKRHLGVPDNIP